MITHQLAQGAGEGLLPYIDRLDALLQSLGQIGLNSALVQHRHGVSTGNISTTFLVTPFGHLACRAIGFQGTLQYPAQNQAIDFLAANPSFQPLFIRDMGDQNRRSLSRDVIMLIGAFSPMTNCGDHLTRLVVLVAKEDIAPGAIGLVQQMTKDGAVGPVLYAINQSTQQWDDQTTGYGSPRQGDAVMYGYPYPCGTVSTTSSTSTTSSSSTTTSTSTSTSTSTTSTLSTSTTSSTSTTTTTPDQAFTPCGSADTDSLYALLVTPGCLNPADLQLSFTGFTTGGDEQVWTYECTYLGSPAVLEARFNMLTLTWDVSLDIGPGVRTWSATGLDADQFLCTGTCLISLTDVVLAAGGGNPPTCSGPISLSFQCSPANSCSTSLLMLTLTGSSSGPCAPLPSPLISGPPIETPTTTEWAFVSGAWEATLSYDKFGDTWDLTVAVPISGTQTWAQILQPGSTFVCEDGCLVGSLPLPPDPGNTAGCDVVLTAAVQCDTSTTTTTSTSTSTSTSSTSTSTSTSTTTTTSTTSTSSTSTTSTSSTSSTEPVAPTACLGVAPNTIYALCTDAGTCSDLSSIIFNFQSASDLGVTYDFTYTGTFAGDPITLVVSYATGDGSWSVSLTGTGVSWSASTLPAGTFTCEGGCLTSASPVSLTPDPGNSPPCDGAVEFTFYCTTAAVCPNALLVANIAGTLGGPCTSPPVDMPCSGPGVGTMYITYDFTYDDGTYTWITLVVLDKLSLSWNVTVTLRDDATTDDIAGWSASGIPAEGLVCPCLDSAVELAAALDNPSGCDVPITVSVACNPVCAGLDPCVEGRRPTLSPKFSPTQPLAESTAYFFETQGYGDLVRQGLWTLCLTGCVSISDDTWACMEGLSEADRTVTFQVVLQDCDQATVDTFSSDAFIITGPGVYCGKLSVPTTSDPAAYAVGSITLPTAGNACIPTGAASVCFDYVATISDVSGTCDLCLCESGDVMNLSLLPSPFPSDVVVQFVSKVDNGDGTCTYTWEYTDGGSTTITVAIQIASDGSTLASTLTATDGVDTCVWSTSGTYNTSLMTCALGVAGLQYGTFLYYDVVDSGACTVPDYPVLYR